ncbi:DUF625-domain-containing protein, partial [Neoconidiobolus thromboides FSU 785]
RVKIYRYQENNWGEYGSGICSIRKYDEASDKHMIVVVDSQDKDSTILSFKILCSGQFKKEQDGLIVWPLVPGSFHLCLSFQGVKIRDAFYGYIQEVEKHLLKESTPEGESDPDALIQQDETRMSFDNLEPTMGNIGEIDAFLLANNQGNFEYKERVATKLIEHKFLEKLKDVYDIATDLEDPNCLNKLFSIIKSLLQYYDPRITESFAHDDYILMIAGIMEHSPGLPHVKQSYVNFLNDPARFKQLISLPDETTERMVRESFRLTYLKETVLSPIMNETASSQFTGVIARKNNEILKRITDNHEFLSRLFNTLRDPEAPINKKRPIILFVQQLCTLGRVSSIGNLTSLIGVLNQKGLFAILRFTMSDPDLKIRVIGAEILAMMVDNNPSLVRSTIKHKVGSDEPTLLELLIRSMIKETSTSVISQYSDIIRSLLIYHCPAPAVRAASNGTNTTDPNLRKDDDLDSFVRYFYDNLIDILISPLIELNDNFAKESSGVVKVLPRHHDTLTFTICDLLNSFLRFHSVKIKYFVIGSHVVKYIVPLLRARSGHVKLAALRFFRNLIGTRDEFFSRTLIRHKIIEHILQTYTSTENANNMLNSACREFFQFIVTEKMITLLKYLAVDLESEVTKLSSVQVFKDIIFYYGAMVNGTPSTASLRSVTPKSERDEHEKEMSPSGKKQKLWATETLEKSEEEYFKEDDEGMEIGESDTTQSESSSNHKVEEVDLDFPLKPLVDYDDEEDEE